MNTIKLIFLSTLLCFIFGTRLEAQSTEKQIIGPVATVFIKDANMSFRGRVDTGAATTSINAHHIKRIGENVQFTILNRAGEEFTITAPIVKENYVRNAESREKRYYVHLTLVYKEVAYTILVNLNDRSKSTYKILLGRNWLSGNFIVDVSLDED